MIPQNLSLWRYSYPWPQYRQNPRPVLSLTLSSPVTLLCGSWCAGVFWDLVSSNKPFFPSSFLMVIADRYLAIIRTTRAGRVTTLVIDKPRPAQNMYALFLYETTKIFFQKICTILQCHQQCMRFLVLVGPHSNPNIWCQFNHHGVFQIFFKLEFNIS